MWSWNETLLFFVKRMDKNTAFIACIKKYEVCQKVLELK